MPPRNGVFFCKLTPPRTTFPKDITPTEAKLMQDHAAYWRGLLSEERVVVFGPVEDPAGTFGIVILRASSETEARGLANNDPVVKANIGFKYDVFATQAVTKPKA